MKVPDGLTVTQQCAVAQRVMQTPDILALARHGNKAGAGKIAKGNASCGGGSEVGGGVGPYWYDAKGVRDDQRNPTWVVTWDRVAAIVLAGLSAGNLAHLSAGWRLYLYIHQHLPNIDCVTDRQSYELWWFPTYCRASRIMREAEDAIFQRAATILEPPTLAEQLDLWGAA